MGSETIRQRHGRFQGLSRVKSRAEKVSNRADSSNCASDRVARSSNHTLVERVRKVKSEDGLGNRSSICSYQTSEGEKDLSVM